MDHKNMVTIIDDDGNSMEVELLAYFKHKLTGNKYIVYTQNEKLENSMVKLFVAKEADGQDAGQEPMTEEEWKMVKRILQKIIAESKDDNYAYELHESSCSVKSEDSNYEKKDTDNTLLTDIARQNNYILLIGEGGMGKSTQLMHLYRQLANGYEAVPLYISLYDYDGESHFIKRKIIQNYFGDTSEFSLQEKYEEVIHMFKDNTQYEYTIILDGINEMSVNLTASNLLEEISNFIKLGNIKIIASSRYDMKQKEFDCFKRFKLCPLGEKIKRKKINNYTSLLQNATLREVLSNPFYLTKYNELSEEDHLAITSTAELMAKYYSAIIEKTRETDTHVFHDNYYQYSKLVVESFFPYLCFEMVQSEKLFFEESELEILWKSWNEEQLSSAKHFLNNCNYLYLDVLEKYNIIILNGNRYRIEEMVRDFFCAYYLKNEALESNKEKFYRQVSKNMFKTQILDFFGSLLGEHKNKFVFDKEKGLIVKKIERQSDFLQKILEEIQQNEQHRNDMILVYNIVTAIGENRNKNLAGIDLSNLNLQAINTTKYIFSYHGINAKADGSYVFRANNNAIELNTSQINDIDYKKGILVACSDSVIYMCCGGKWHFARIEKYIEEKLFSIRLSQNSTEILMTFYEQKSNVAGCYLIENIGENGLPQTCEKIHFIGSENDKYSVRLIGNELCIFDKQGNIKTKFDYPDLNVWIENLNLNSTNETRELCCINKNHFVSAYYTWSPYTLAGIHITNNVYTQEDLRKIYNNRVPIFDLSLTHCLFERNTCGVFKGQLTKTDRGGWYYAYPFFSSSDGSYIIKVTPEALVLYSSKTHNIEGIFFVKQKEEAIEKEYRVTSDGIVLSFEFENNSLFIDDEETEKCLYYKDDIIRYINKKTGNDFVSIGMINIIDSHSILIEALSYKTKQDVFFKLNIHDDNIAELCSDALFNIVPASEGYCDILDETIKAEFDRKFMKDIDGTFYCIPSMDTKKILCFSQNGSIDCINVEKEIHKINSAREKSVCCTLYNGEQIQVSFE